MKDYYYESSNGDFAFVSEFWCNGDSLIINGSGESTISMRFPSGYFDTKDGRQLWIAQQKHSFRVKGKLNMNIDLSMFVFTNEVLFPGEYSLINSYREADEGTKTAVRKLLEIGEFEKEE